MKKIPGLSSRGEKRIFDAVLPLVIVSLVKQGIIRAEHLQSDAKLLEVFGKNLKRGTNQMEWCVAIEEEFIREALTFWEKDQKLLAIVLYAAAVEQYVNQTYALMLQAHGLEKQEIEKIVRTLNIEPKLSWLLKLVAKKEFPKALGKRLRSVFDLRNAIVHFKGIPDHPDKYTDSYSRIKSELGKLRRLSLSRDYRLLTEALWKITLEKDPSLDLALKATDMLFALRQKVKPA